MKYKFIFFSSFLILLFSCEKKEKQTIVGWKIIEEYPEEHLVIVDTFGSSPYNNSTLEFKLEIDSMLKAKEKKFLNDGQEFFLGEFEISLLGNSSFNLSGQELNFSKISIYHNDWPWNQIYFYSPEYGIVAEFHSHSRRKNMLVFMIIENDTVYKLGEQLLEYFENDSILNPIPPMPIEPSEIIEVFE
ncbi:hypothetical protein ACPUEN_14020 [Algoriphagus yeomjeoni]|uniref:hypothetical protein n=1 Tax=Algoriphagus yeomjeoni TaxID=291403 RepID=UPI003CE45E4C